MNLIQARTLLAVLVCLGVSPVARQAHAEPTRATFPENIDELEHYTTVKRRNVIEHILTTPEAIAAVKAGQPIPNGTHFVLADYRDGKIFRYFIMEKGAGWGADYPESRRTGDWQFQWFNPDKTINAAENTARCQSCHQSRADQEYLYTADAISEFNGHPVE